MTRPGSPISHMAPVISLKLLNQYVILLTFYKFGDTLDICVNKTIVITPSSLCPFAFVSKSASGIIPFVSTCFE